MKRSAFTVGLLALSAAICAAQAGTAIKWFQFQIEVADQVKAMTKAYSAEHPGVSIDASVIGDPYWDQLKVRAASKDMPDVFMTDGYSRIKTYRNYILDISAEKRLTANIYDAAKTCISLDGKTLGIPVQMSAWGVIYNKDLFEKAGVQVPTTYSALVKACEAFKAKGITPFVDQYKDAWLLGQLIGSGIGKIDKPLDFAKMENEGKAKLASQTVMKRNIEILDLSLKYGQENPMNAGWNEACTLMGQGKGAMMLEGIWVYDTIKSIDPEIRLGMFALPYDDNPDHSRLSADVNGVLHVASGGKNEKVAKDILAWLIGSDSGKKFFKDCKFIPAVKGIDSDLNDVGKDAFAYIEQGKTTLWGWLIGPDNFQAESGMVYQEYIMGKYNAKTILPALDARWAKLAGKK